MQFLPSSRHQRAGDEESRQFHVAEEVRHGRVASTGEIDLPLDRIAAKEPVAHGGERITTTHAPATNTSNNRSARHIPRWYLGVALCIALRACACERSFLSRVPACS